MKTILAGIRLIILDVDGVLTDGKIYWSMQGECMKVFNAKDGFRIHKMAKAGYRFAIITGGKTEMVKKRAEYMGVEHVFLDVMDKLPVFESLIQLLQIQPKEVAYMGDDRIDLPVLQKVGLPACPKDAIPEVQSVCTFISQYNGGCGAVRELCDAIWEVQHPCDG